MHGEYDAALDSVKEILGRDPANVNAKVIQSQAYLGQKKYGDSDTLLAAVLKTNPSSPDVYFQAGMSNRSQGKLAAAEMAFLRAWEFESQQFPEPAFWAWWTWKSCKGSPEKAMTLLQNEAKKAPNRMDIVLLMGLTARRVGKFQDSLTYLTRVLDGLDKKSKARADVYYEISETYRLAGDRDNAHSPTCKRPVRSPQKARRSWSIWEW